jgi:hypothetical protein
MPLTIKYNGNERGWDELSITGKQSVWNPGQQEERSDTEAALLIGTGLFSRVFTDSLAALGAEVEGLQTTMLRPSAIAAGVTGLHFPRGVVSAPVDGLDYASGPATAVCSSGRILAAYRVGSRHDLTGGGQPGPMVCAASDDGGKSWGSRQIVFDWRSDGHDVGDAAMCVHDGVVYVYTWRTVSAGISAGLYVSSSTNEGRTWSEPALTYFAEAALSDNPVPVSGGGWAWTIYQKLSGYWTARLLTAETPAGPWSVRTVYASALQNITEWSFAQVSATNWVAMARNSTTLTMDVLQSTDAGVTWSAATALPTTPTQYNGWPALRLGLDGRVLAFVRGQGAGQRVLQLLDPAQALTASAWAEPGPNGGRWAPLDTATGGNFVGAFRPVRVGSQWLGAYQAETTASEVSEIRFGIFDERALQSAFSWVATSEKIADGSTPAWTVLTTPDLVRLRSPGGLYRIAWNVRSAQASGTVSNFQIDVFVNGVAVGDQQSLFLTIGGTTRNNTSGYYDNREGVLYLAPGLHTIELRYRQDTTTVGRSFLSRQLSVSPF